MTNCSVTHCLYNESGACALDSITVNDLGYCVCCRSVDPEIKKQIQASRYAAEQSAYACEQHISGNL